MNATATSSNIKVITGNAAAAIAAKLARPDVVAAYPITPQTEVIEQISSPIRSLQKRRHRNGGPRELRQRVRASHEGFRRWQHPRVLERAAWLREELGSTTR